MHWAARLGASGLPAPLFTIRRIDLVPLSTGLDGDPAPAEVDVLPWSDTDVERYCDLRFPSQDNPVWQAITAHERGADLVALMRNPFNLKLQCDLFRDDGGRLAPHRGALLGRIGLLRLREALREHKLPPLPPDLLHPDDARHVQQMAAPPAAGSEPGALHSLQLRGALLRTLAALCRRLHERDGAAWSRFAHGDAVLHDTSGQFDLALQAAQALLLLQDDRGTLRLAHQLWQEYLAAIQLAQGRQAADWPDLAPPPQPAVAETDWQLPAPQPSEWDQCAQLAVQIAPEPQHLLRHLADTNLALAARAALSLGVHRLPPELLASLRQRLLARCQDAATGLPQRIEAGELLGLLGDDIRYETGTGPDGDAYRVPRWASHWLPVPAGKRLIGGLADWEDSANTVEVDIPPGLRLAFAPVTNAEFRCFVKAGGYGGQDDSEPPVWWEGAAARRWWRGELANEGHREAWLDARRRWVSGEQAWVRKNYFSGTSDDDFDAGIRLRLDADEAEFDRWLDGLCAPQRHRLPNWWDLLRFANPLQPVVGVSLFEGQAYARWLSHQTGQRIRLPHEAEGRWPRAAVFSANGPGLPVRIQQVFRRA